MDRIPHTEASDVLNGALNLVFAVLGAVAVGFIIYGGVTYITSAGDPGKAKKARMTLTFAIIGLVIVLASFAIVNFIVGSV